MSIIIAISNEKGGVGKTTTALSLGSALTKEGQRVLLVDLDQQADLTIGLGVDPSKTPLTVANLLLDTAAPQDIIRQTQFPGIDLIPANSEIKAIERLLPQRPDYETTLRRKLNEPPFTDYRVIILDCPPVIGVATLNALTACQLLLIPTQVEYFSIYALKNMMGYVRKMRKESNPAMVYRLLITMMDQRNRTHRTLSEQLRATFKNGVLETAIEIDTKLRESPIAGAPINLYAPNSRASTQYCSLAAELLPLITQIEQIKETVSA